MSEYNIQMNKYNALNVEYDQLYPATKIENVDGLNTALQNKADLGENGKVLAEQVDAYSQSDSISAETRTALNLAETATPDAALAEIARKLSESAGAIESTEYPGCYYRMVDGVVEWVNPPMIKDVEYRTTERYQGRVVYQQLFSLGQMPSSAGKTEIIISENFGDKTVISLQGFMTNNSSGIGGWCIKVPEVTSQGVLYRNISFSGPRIEVYTGGNTSSYYGFAILKYTKNV